MMWNGTDGHGVGAGPSAEGRRDSVSGVMSAASVTNSVCIGAAPESVPPASRRRRRGAAGNRSGLFTEPPDVSTSCDMLCSTPGRTGGRLISARAGPMLCTDQHATTCFQNRRQRTNASVIGDIVR